MTDDLVVTARFPLGLYQGAGADGIAQAFPAPSRLAAALLSVCGTEGVEAVRELFDADPPLIEHPDVAPGVPQSWWRPQSGRWREEFDVNKQTAVGRIEGRPLPYAVYGDESVWYRWVGLGRLAEALRVVAERVPYLGRATGPVVLRVERVTTQPGAVECSRVRLTPARDGTQSVTVPTPALFDDLETAHAARLDLDAAGFDLPVQVVRAEANYTKAVGVREAAVDSSVCADWRTVDRYLTERFTLLLPAAPVPAASVDLCCRWIHRVTDADAVLPVSDREGVLRAVLVERVEPVTRSVSVATFTGTVTFSPDRTGEVTASQRWLGARLRGTSPLWVSHVGIDPDDLAGGRALLDELARTTGTAVVACATSSAPRDPRLPDLAGTGRQYLSVQFATPLRGPIYGSTEGPLGVVHFLPVDPQSGAVL